jgi:hypothetical protein
MSCSALAAPLLRGCFHSNGEDTQARAVAQVLFASHELCEREPATHTDVFRHEKATPIARVRQFTIRVHVKLELRVRYDARGTVLM